jgi:hypothetical protein
MLMFNAETAKYLVPLAAALAGGAGSGFYGYDVNTELRAANEAALAAKQQTIELKQGEIEVLWARYSVDRELCAQEEEALDQHIKELQQGMRDTIMLCKEWKH